MMFEQLRASSYEDDDSVRRRQGVWMHTKNRNECRRVRSRRGFATITESAPPSSC